MKSTYSVFLMTLTLMLASSALFGQTKKALKIHRKAEKKLSTWQVPAHLGQGSHKVGIDTIMLDLTNHALTVQCGDVLSNFPIREADLHKIEESLRQLLGHRFEQYKIYVTTRGHDLAELVPNFYRTSMRQDTARYSRKYDTSRIPLVRRVDREAPTKGLYNKNIALWHSHGLYYEAKLDRWEWQRARLYSTVEDMLPMQFVLPYLAPMLENAGGNVFLPRERDVQKHEVIVDNDASSQGSTLMYHQVMPDTLVDRGFLKKDTLFAGENPFLMGSCLQLQPQGTPGYLEYLPAFPADGDYAVYVSFVQSPQNTKEAKCSVFHAGGQTDFLINQQMGGGTWVYLGTFHFRKGIHPGEGAVRLYAADMGRGMVTADAVRFGGGVGNVARRPNTELSANQWSLRGGVKENGSGAATKVPGHFHWKTSGAPRYLEGARYYLQYAGMPDSLVYNLNKDKNDYNDDYQSRGEWVDYLMGAPNGPNVNRQAAGLHIPIDLSLAFHTDAGVLPKDSTVGTLAIYSTVSDQGVFPDGQSKMASRDLADMVQTEVVHDIRAQFDPTWQRRAMWDKQYSEAWRPNVPAMLLELLSHQNLTDMRFGLNPLFRFAVSRAIYKAITKYLAFQNHTSYVIQPLPVDHFAMQRIGKNTIRLSWLPVVDTLEPGAMPTAYKVYRRLGDGGFDNGVLVHKNEMEVTIDQRGLIYSFRVTALNDGGESMPGEILSVGLLDNDRPMVTVVNAFDRVDAPAIIDEGNFAGVAFWQDEGVADRYNIGFSGRQYDFDRTSQWLDDDSPGWGASYGSMEGKPVPGNSFDNTVVHGQAILDAGYSYLSVSDEAFCSSDFVVEPLAPIDIIFGEEKTTVVMGATRYQVFDQGMRAKLSALTHSGHPVFASGAYIGTDHIVNGDTLAGNFAREVLHFTWRTNHATQTGAVVTTDYARKEFTGSWNFNTFYDPEIYRVEAPDALEPAGEGAILAFRYAENRTGAGVVFSGSYKAVVLGFPFETLVSEKQRADLMKQILNFFDLDNKK